MMWDFSWHSHRVKRSLSKFVFFSCSLPSPSCSFFISSLLIFCCFEGHCLTFHTWRLVPWGGVRLSLHVTLATIWLVVLPPEGRWWWEWINWWNENWQGKLKHSEKTCRSATLSTTNPTLSDLELNPGRHGGKLATNRLSYGTSFLEDNHCLLHIIIRLLDPWH
jgi:hypothetical protein